ncbi:MAG: PAS domain S-box protein, partial [Desulfuromonadales bacterium]
GMFMNKAIDEGKRLAQLELRLRRKNGEIFPAEAKLAFMEEDDRVVGVTALLRDISERKEAENKLQQSHDFFHYLLTSIPEAVFYVKLPERVIAWANDSYNIMGLGVNPEHIKDLSTKDFFASEEEYERFGVVQRQAVEEGQPIMHTETMLRHADGRVFPADVTGTFFREGGKVTGITAIARDITEVKNAEKKFIDYQERLKALSSQLTFAEEQERRRIAENLHDEVSQALAMTRLQLAAASRGAKCDDPELKDQLDEISGSLLQAIRDTRQLIFELSSPAMHELGLGPAISEWVEEKKKKFENEVDITVDDKLSGNELDDNERTILFRNIRELLNNAFKHARAKKINISLAADEEAVQITIKDDGIGFNPGQVMNGHQMDGGFGLFSVEERMKDVNGTMEIDAAPHRGCKVTLSLKRATEL